MSSEPLLSVRHLTKHFPVTRGVFGRRVGAVRAVDDISFDLWPKETLGLVGESGSGKTTAGRAILRLIEPTSGEVRFAGRDLAALSAAELRQQRREMQIIFQDPYSSLNPRMRVRDIIGEALRVHGFAKGDALEAQVRELLAKVGVPGAFSSRYPHEFSGGQRQRIGIARAIALNPKFIVCDEAVSALDVSIRAQVINLLIALRDELSLSYLFISHDLSVVKHISNRIAVMYLGQIVELADADQLFRNPAHPYTRSLLSAIPLPDPRHRQARVVLEGDVPTPLNPPSGCRFHTRCPAAFERCPQEEPELIVLGANHTTKCHHADGLEGNDAWFEELDRRITKQEELNRAKAAASSQPAPAPAQQSQARPRRTAAAPHSQPHSEAARDMPRHLARACVLAGLLAVVLGLWLLGAALVLAAYVIAIRKNLERPLPADIGIFAALVLALLVSDAVKSQSAQTRARHELNALAQHIEAYRTAAQSPPNSLTELGWRLYEIFPDGRPTDPWGRLYTYDPPSPDRDGRISSEGPSPDRKDDLVVRIPP